MHLSNLIQTYFTFFFCFVFSLLTTLVQLGLYCHWWNTTAVLLQSFWRRKQERRIDTNTTCRSRHAHTPLLLWKKKLTRAGLYFKSIIKRIDKCYTYSETPSFIMLHWETWTSEPYWSFFFCISPSFRFKFSQSSVYSFFFFPCSAL